MGYSTSLSGDFTIVPPLTWKELSQLEPCGWGRYVFFSIQVDEDETETDEGVLVKKTGREVDVYYGECKAYTIEQKLQQLVDDIPGHELRGEVIGDGEDAGDYWRLFVKDGKVIREKAKLVWPDGSDVVL